MEQKRKLAAILHADIVGFSRLMATDEAGTHRRLAERLASFRAAVERHGGRIVNTAGDSVLAEFPSVSAALACAVEIQSEEAHGLVFRIGLNLGEVIADGGELYGDGVNLAARLQAIAEPGAVCLSASAYDQLHGKTPHQLRPLGERRLKGIPKPVPVWSVGGRARRRLAPTRVTALAGTAAAVALALGLAGSLLQGDPRQAAPAAVEAPLPGIAVLPFANLSGDASQDYFGAGVTEDIVAALGRFRELRVASKSAVLPWRERNAPPEEVARGLGVRYLVEGSVRRAGERVRVAAQLVEAGSGRHLWSDRWEGEVKDLFSVQDEIVRRIVSSLAVRLGRAEQERLAVKPPTDLAAYDHLLRARALLVGDRATNLAARDYLERALQIDPTFAPAYAALGQAIYWGVVSGWTEFPDDDLDRATALARHALSLDSGIAGAHQLLGNILRARRQFEPAERAYDEALALNPSDVESQSGRGTILMWTGRSAEAASVLEAVLRADPGHPNARWNLALALYSSKRYEDAAVLLQHDQGRRQSRVFDVFALATLAMAQAQLGHAAEAADAAQRLKRISPFFDAEVFADQWQSERDRAHIADGLAKAGLD